MRLIVLGAVAISILASISAVRAADTGLWVEPTTDKTSLQLYFDGPDDRNDESLMGVLECSHGQGDTFTAASLFLVAEEGTRKAAQALLAAYGDDKISHFKAGKLDVPAPVQGFTVDTDDMAGDWDLTVQFLDSDLTLIEQVGKLAGAGTLTYTIGKTVFDLTPRDEDRAAFATFARQCGK